MSKEGQEDNSWLIDLILSFFHSAEWKAPVLSFIEEKCVVFDDEEENKLEYTVLHKDFKKLAEGLIEAMLWELGATPQMFGEAFDKAQNTPGYQKITKIIESIDNYEIFAKMMRKKNASLNEAAFKMLQMQEEGETKHHTDPVKPSGKVMEETKTVPTATGKPHDKKERKKELQQKKELGRLNTLESEELSQLEIDQMKLIQDISMREEEERRKIEEEEERILQQVLEMSSREHEDELKQKETSIDEKERLLKEKEEKLKRDEEKLKKDKAKLKKKKKKEKERVEKEKEEKEKADKEKADLEKAEAEKPKADVQPPVETKAPIVAKKKKKLINAEPSNSSTSDNSKTGESTPKEALSKDYDLPPVSKGGRTGAMMANDYDILKAASSDLFKKKEKDLSYDPYNEEPNFDPWNKPKDDEGKSLRDLMKEKIEKSSAPKEEKTDQRESMEERKARLKAQRDLLVQKKKQDMESELKQAREGNTDNKYSNNLFKDLMALDKKVSQQEAKKKKVSHPQPDSPETKPAEDDEAEVIGGKKDMKSLFDDSDEEKESKKLADDKARKDRHVQIMKQMAEDK